MTPDTVIANVSHYLLLQKRPINTRHSYLPYAHDRILQHRMPCTLPHKPSSPFC